MKAKITSTVFGGGLKLIDEKAVIDLAAKTITMLDGTVIELQQINSPLHKKRGKEFYKNVGKLFFFSVGSSTLFLVWATNLLATGDMPIYMKFILLASPLAVLYYLYEIITNAEKRQWISETKKKILMVPFASLFIGVIFALFLPFPGFAVSALLFSALSAIFIEEYFVKELNWLMRGKVSFFKPSVQSVQNDEFKSRYENIENFILFIEKSDSEKQG